MNKKIFIIVACLCLVTAVVITVTKVTTSKKEMEVVTIDPTSILKLLDGVPIGINVNFYLDSDESMEAPRSIEETIKAMGVKYLRYPGGDKSDEYLFSKPPYDKAEPHASRKGRRASVGRSIFMTPDGMDYRNPPMDFDQFMELCHKTGCEPEIVVACDNRKNPHPEGTYSATREELIENAVEWVRYANIRHGHKIRYWMIGNECWHSNVSTYYTIDDYVEDIILFSDAMKAVDPSILIIPNTNNRNFTRRILADAGDKVDMMCISNYSMHENPGHYDGWATGKKDVMRAVKETVAHIEQFAPEGKKGMKVIVAEYGPFDWASDGWGVKNDMGHTLCNFEMTGRQLLDERVPFSCYWNTRWEKHTKDSYNTLDENNEFLPIAYSISLWANNLYPQMVEVVSSSENLMVFSSCNLEQNVAYIYVMNLTDMEITTRFEVKGKKIKKSELVGRIKGESPEDLNPITEIELQSVGKKVSLPAYSINVYRTYF